MMVDKKGKHEIVLSIIKEKKRKERKERFLLTVGIPTVRGRAERGYPDRGKTSTLNISHFGHLHQARKAAKA
jgi:hypothetical protein